jgi:hypothetical protein
VVDVLEDGFEIYHFGFIRSHSVRLNFQLLEDVRGVREVEELERLLEGRKQEIREKIRAEFKALLYGRRDGKLVALVLQKWLDNGIVLELICVDVNQFMVDLRAALKDP